MSKLYYLFIPIQKIASYYLTYTLRMCKMFGVLQLDSITANKSVTFIVLFIHVIKF